MKCMPSTLSGRFVAAPSDGDRDRRRVRREDHVGLRDRVERAEQRRVLASSILDDGLDDVVGVGQRVEVVPVVETRRAPRRDRAAVSLPFSTNFAEALLDRRARAIERRRRVSHSRTEPRLREHLRDAVAHRARADDADTCRLMVASLRSVDSDYGRLRSLDREGDAVAAAEAQRRDAALQRRAASARRAASSARARRSRRSGGRARPRRR